MKDVVGLLAGLLIVAAALLIQNMDVNPQPKHYYKCFDAVSEMHHQKINQPLSIDDDPLLF